MTRRDENKERRKFECDGNIHYTDCGGDFTDISTCQYFGNCTL